MNKFERRLRGDFKRKKRSVYYPGWIANYKLRRTGKPCSCIFCSPGKAIINGVKKKEKKEIELAFL